MTNKMTNKYLEKIAEEGESFMERAMAKGKAMFAGSGNARTGKHVSLKDASGGFQSPEAHANSSTLNPQDIGVSRLTRKHRLAQAQKMHAAKPLTRAAVAAESGLRLAARHPGKTALVAGVGGYALGRKSKPDWA